jgi:crotonobetainyl-CoA:carnitine CoA-transferase CaiB-like acyl-CoA transferase
MWAHAGSFDCATLSHFTYHDATGESLGRTGNMDPTMSPSGIFKTRDGKFVAVAIATDKQFQSFCKALGREDIAQNDIYKKAASRLKRENALALNKVLEEWVITKDVQELSGLARKHRFAAAEVMDDVQISQDKWREERGSAILFEDDMYKKLLVEGPIAMLSKTPGRIKWLTRPLGYHNRYVFKKILGLTEDQIKDLEKERVVGTWDYRVGQRPPIYHDLSKDRMFNYEGGEDH